MQRGPSIGNNFQKPTEELTKADLAKVTYLDLHNSRFFGGGAFRRVVIVTNVIQLDDVEIKGRTMTPSEVERIKRIKLEQKEWEARTITDTSLKDVAMLQNLETLLLGHTQITTAGFKELAKLQKLTKLTFLNLMSSQLTELPKGLEKLTQLERLNLTYNKLTDLKGLEKLTQLKDLRLSNNPDLTKSQIDQLQKALPKCEINSNPTK
jgi:hypothetical protein